MLVEIKQMEYLRQLLERSAFGVCTYIGERIGIASSRVRLYFIYFSFLTMGSPIIFYLIAAFWLNIKESLKKGRDLLSD